MKNLQIWDNGGKSFDRYTIFKAREHFVKYWYKNKLFDAIGSCKTGNGFYLHIEAAKGPHLGKRVKFEDLDKQLQNRLINEFKS